MVYIYYILYVYNYYIYIYIYINLQCSDLPWQVEYIEWGCKDDNSTWEIEYRYGIWNSHKATSNQIRHYIFFKYDRAQFPTQWPPLTSRIDWERLQRETTLHGRLLSAILSFSFYVYGFFANFRYDLIIRLFSDMFITRKHWRKINIPSLFSSL